MAQGIQGRFVWQELTTEDPATAVAFYSKVVGWHAHPNPSHPTYTEFGIGSSHTAGMMALTDDARAAGVDRTGSRTLAPLTWTARRRLPKSSAARWCIRPQTSRMWAVLPP